VGKRRRFENKIKRETEIALRNSDLRGGEKEILDKTEKTTIT